MKTFKAIEKKKENLVCPQMRVGWYIGILQRNGTKNKQRRKCIRRIWLA